MHYVSRCECPEQFVGYAAKDSLLASVRVYLGSYNFSSPADVNNGENLVLIRDRRIVVSYVIEALRIFDH